MAISSYDLETSLSGHIDSVNTLQFSPSGKHLASGGQDGQLFIFSTKTWKPIRKYADASPLTALAWHPSFPRTVICGFASGDLITICLDGAQVYLPLSSSVSSISYSLGCKRGKDVGRQDVRHRCVYRPRRSGGYNRNRSWREGVSDRPDNNMCVFYCAFSCSNQGDLSAVWRNIRVLPDPPSFENLKEKLSAPSARSLHFMREKDSLLVSYLEHGLV